MAERFLKFIPGRDAFDLARKHKNAFILLMFIASRARRTNGERDGYTIGQCHIGDHKEFGLTEKEYRTAKKVLVEQKFIKIIETCRTRKKKSGQSQNKLFKNHENWADERATERATRSTTIGTLVELCDTSIYDINPNDENQQKGDRKGEDKGDRGATEGRPKGDEQEREECKEREEDKNIAQSASRPRSKGDGLSFNFDSWEYIGITDIDMAQWKIIYPHLDLKVEITKSINWLKSNPSKSNKTLWRKFLTGWFQRANDSSENKKAFKAAGGAQGADRRTKDMDGNPVDNQYVGKF